MTGIYMVSAQKPTAVTHSILARVTSPNDLNLIISKSTLIEIYKVTAEGLKFVKQIGIWGVVENLNKLRLKNEKKDFILITTSKYDLMVLSCEENNDGIYEILTRTHGNFKDSVPRNSSIRMITIVDSHRSNPLIAIKCYDGILKTIQITSEYKQLNVSTLRMEDINIIDLVFLNGYNNPTIGLICKEPNTKLLFKVYEFDPMNNKEFSNLIWKKEINDNQAFIIPVPEPCEGVIIVGTQSISYLNANNEFLQKAPHFLAQGEITNYALIDLNGQRFLLSNTMGQLFLMILVHEETMNSTKVVDIRFETLGETVIADNMTYIDNGVVFIGSKLGDSQLIKLIDKPNQNGSFLDLLETYTNLGPILDMLIVDIEKQGQGQLITCSGGHKNGTLRIIRSGIGIQESANVELSGIKSLWTLKVFSSEYHDHLVLSFYSYTKIFSFIDEEFEDVELDGFDLSTQTLCCSNVCNNQILQITCNSVRILKSFKTNCKLVAEWKVPDNELISVATCSENECLIACRNQLFYLSIKDQFLIMIKNVSLEFEIACLDIYRLDSANSLCAVGLWGDISARLLTIPDLEEVCAEPLKGDVIPRSILIENMEQIMYMFVSLGDGSVISYVIKIVTTIDDERRRYELTERRKIVLGTQPTILRKFHSVKSVSSTNIFACSDRPSVISSMNQKLVYSSVNLKQVDFMCELNTKAYPNSLALLTAGTLRIGTMDSIQKLHIRSVELNETARRISYQAETQTFGVITYRMDLVMSNGETRPLIPSASSQCSNQQLCRAVHSASSCSTNTETLNQSVNVAPSTSKSSNEMPSDYSTQIINSFLILDQNTFEVLHSVQFQPNEFAVSILSMSFDSDPNTTYYLVGCCLVCDDDPEPKVGRIVLFKYADNKLLQVHEKELKGAPYCLQNYNGKLLISISNSIKLFEFKDGQLNQVASYSDNVFIIHMKCKNDFILVGDMMKSCSILTYRPETNTFELVAKDHSPIWLSSIEMVDDDNFLMSDCFLNVLSLKKDSGQSNEEERKNLQIHGCVHLGEQINVFRHGSLGMQEQSNELLNNHFQHMMLAGTVNGSIILFAQMSDLMFKILNELQVRLAKFLTTAGKIQYDKWRMFESERRAEESKGFVDGDLIESFLELSQSEAADIVKDFKIDNSTIGHSNEEFSVNYFTKLVEELSRIH